MPRGGALAKGACAARRCGVPLRPAGPPGCGSACTPAHPVGRGQASRRRRPSRRLFSDTGSFRMACFRLETGPGRRHRPSPQPPPVHRDPPVTPSPPRLPLCRTSKFHPWFCTHTAHDGPPVRSDSLSGVISAIARGGSVAPALRPESTDYIRDRAAVAGLRGREGGVRAPGTSYTPRARTSQRAASHPLGSSRLAHIPPLISPRGIASKQTGHPASRRCTGGQETVLPSTSRNGARQEPEDNADQAGRSQGRAAREGRSGS